MRWPYYEHVFFDCDSTLTTVEGIDILAASSSKRWRVEVLTQAAMEGSLDLQAVYAKRLQALKPTRKQVQEIRRIYKRHVVEDAAAVVGALQYLGHKVYIVSGGLAEPVTEFGIYLGVSRQNIRAVDVNYNQLSGAWWENGGDYDRYLTFSEGALTVSDGKAEIVQELLGGQHGRSLLIGDGVSDLLAGTAVDLFVGFGGVIKRARVLADAPVFIHSASIAPLLALATGPAMLRKLQTTSYKTLATKALNLIETGAISFRDEQLSHKFTEALDASR